MRNCYIPPAYKPRLFPRAVRCVLVALGCFAVVAFFVFGAWVLDALYH